MALKDRLRRLERRTVPKEPERFEVHVHAIDEDPRQSCELCRAMNAEEYAAFRRGEGVWEVNLSLRGDNERA